MAAPESVLPPVDTKVNKQHTEIRMKKGDYRVHVYFEQCRSLTPAKDCDLSDPVFIVTTFGVTKSTKSFSNVSIESILPIGEHIFIDGLSKIPEEVKSERIRIEVRDHNKLLKDKPLGSFEFDMGFVYASEGHAIMHKWVVLSIPSDENFFEPKGYVKLGVSVTHEADSAVDLCEEIPGLRDESAMLPTFIKPKLEQIIIQVIKAENLPVMDIGGTLDIFCIASISGYECRSSVIQADKGNFSAMWLEELYLPCIVPCVSTNIQLTFMDYDSVSKDDFVGSLNLNYQEVKKGKYKDFFWCNIYGAPPLAESPAADIMNKVPEMASHWRGRVLLTAQIVEKENVVKKMQKIKENNFEQMIIEKFETGDMREIRAQIQGVSGLPFKSGKYKIKVEWSGVETISTEKSTENGSIDWFEICKRKVAQVPQGTEELMPDVFVYLIHGDEKICYLRVPAKECFEKEKSAIWRNFKPDKHVGKVKDIWNAGMIRIKLYIGLYVEGESEGKWGVIKQPDTQKWILYSHIYQCRDLKAADKNGLADSYLSIYCAGNELTTKDNPCEMTLNPRWYKTFSLPITIVPPKYAAPVLVRIFDYDSVDEDDFMGIVQIDMSDVAVDPETSPKPTWLRVTLGDKEHGAGEILAAFSLSSRIDVEKKFKIKPLFVEKQIDINVLGLRDLKPAVGWLPVNKAFVRFDLNSLEKPGVAVSAKAIETQPFEEGSDPNILTMLSAKCVVPVDPLFASSFTVTVHDSVFNGVSQPLLGSFSINLAKYFYKTSYIGRFAESLVKQTNVINFKSLIKKAIKSEGKNEKKIEEAKRNESGNSFIQVAQNANKLVIAPSFKVNEKGVAKEVNIPDPSIYMPIGWNRNCEDGKKHYRYKLDGVLETTHLFTYLPFEEFPIYRASFEEDSLNSNPDAPIVQEVGKFKANIRVRNSTEEPVDDEFKKVTSMLLNKRKYVVRVYVLDAFDLEQKDSDSLSDPYVRIKFGDTVISDKENHQEDLTDPKIFKVFDIHTTLPGKSMLKVQMWDFNQYASDSKIGTTRIDLENRFFNKEWNNLPHKPIETRPLFLRSCRRPQGYIRLWVEIIENLQLTDPIDISLKPPMAYEARLIIWKSENVPDSDPNDPGDLYVKAKVNNAGESRTDTHYKVSKGFASWNWRMKFNVVLPQRLENVLNLQIWDKDFLSGNDFVSEHSCSFQAEALEAYEDNVIVKMKGDGKKPVEPAFVELGAFWVECKGKTGLYGGDLLVSFELVPEHIAKNNKVGEGRNEPNHSPALPKPTGRFIFSLNPCKMLGQMVGHEISGKACLFICLGIIILLIIFAIPVFLTNGVAKEVFN